MNISVIIPIHEFNETVEGYLTKAIKSVEEQKNFKSLEDIPLIILVYAQHIEADLESYIVKQKFTCKLFLIKNENNSDFQSQINLASDSVKTDYFTILEYDDELSSTYFKNVIEHTIKLNKVDLFLPFIIEVNENNEVLKITNEIVWSKQFVGENGVMGYLNIKSLNGYTDFKISGAVFKKSEFEAVGKFKTNIKLTFVYEYLLRLLNNGGTVYSIPKIGVKHLAIREGSLFHVYGATMPLKERKFWFETAKKESNFFNDRLIDLSTINI